MPDLAELAALLQMYKLHLKAKSIYPPGLEIHIIHDGSYIANVFGVSLEEVRAYERYFSRLVGALGEKDFIHVHDLEALSQPAGFTNLGQQAARLRNSIRCWSYITSAYFYGVDIVRQPGGHRRPRAFRYVRRNRAGRGACLHRGAARRNAGRCGRPRVALARVREDRANIATCVTRPRPWRCSPPVAPRSRHLGSAG